MKVAKVFSAARLWQYRLDCQLTRFDASTVLDKLGCQVHYKTIQNWEQGKTVPDADYLPYLAAAYKVKMEDFYE